jgi:hypothetical protein
MKKRSNLRLCAWLGSGIVIPSLLAGCMTSNSLVDRCSSIPAGAIPQPIGTHTNEIFSRQVTKAEPDQFVIYLYEWRGDTAFLGPFGSGHIHRMAERLPKVPFPVVIEPDIDAALNEARRAAVVGYLEKNGITNAQRLVTIGIPQAEGIYGEEAERIYRGMIYSRSNNYGGGNQNNFGGNQGFGLGQGLGGGTFR